MQKYMFFEAFGEQGKASCEAFGAYLRLGAYLRNLSEAPDESRAEPMKPRSNSDAVACGCGWWLWVAAAACDCGLWLCTYT